MIGRTYVLFAFTLASHVSIKKGLDVAYCQCGISGIDQE